MYSISRRYDNELENWKRFNRNSIIFLILIFTIVTIVTCLIFYFALKDSADQPRHLIQACIDQGYLPQYTVDAQGNVVEYLGCVRP